MRRKEFPATLEGGPFITGMPPRLTKEQREYVRRIELRRRKLSKLIAKLVDLRRALPSRLELAVELACGTRTVADAARGRVYQRDKFKSFVSRETTTNNPEISQ